MWEWEGEPWRGSCAGNLRLRSDSDGRRGVGGIHSMRAGGTRIAAPCVRCCRAGCCTIKNGKTWQKLCGSAALVIFVSQDKRQREL